MPTTERDLSREVSDLNERSLRHRRFSTAALAGIRLHALLTARLLLQEPDDPDDYIDDAARDLNLAFSGVISGATALAVLVVVGILSAVRRAGVMAAGLVTGTAAGVLLLAVAAVSRG